MLSGLFTRDGLETWYPTLIKSPLTPPDFVFPIVWTVLYTMMGFALYYVWTSPKKSKYTAISLFLIQLVFNFYWSWIFFHTREPFLALLDMQLLIVTLIATMMLFFQHSRLAGSLLIPYLVWVLFAFYLNAYIVLNNPSGKFWF